MNRTRPVGAHMVSMAVSFLVNAGIFVAIIGAGLAAQAPPEAPEHVMAEMVELPRLGETPPDPKALPRIVETPEPELETDTASLSRELEERLEREKKEKEKKRKLAEEKKRLEDKRKREEALRKKKEEARKRRKAALAKAMNKIRDMRADDEDMPGFKQGHELGRSTDANSLKNKIVYTDLVRRIIQRQFDQPAVIPPDVRARLETTVYFRINTGGKIKGKPRVVQSSNNRFFDEAAIRAVKRFSPGSRLKIPLPKDRRLRREVLRKGFSAILKGSK